MMEKNSGLFWDDKEGKAPFWGRVWFFLRDAFLFLWMLPQNIVGLIVLPFAGVTWHYRYGMVTIYHATKFKGGSISLGRFVFLHPQHWDSYETHRHEYGHFLQGIFLGWLYLFVIGLPSIIWAGYFGIWRAKNHKSYYWLYTEAWADKLAGVKR